jgi:predicted homoserine dehydrogenase-like protein
VKSKISPSGSASSVRASWAKAWPTRSFTPYHLVHFEVPNAIARAVLFRDPVIRPLGGPVVEVCAAPKRDLTAGEVLDDYGMYMTYGEAVNVEEMCAGRYLPEGLAAG